MTKNKSKQHVSGKNVFLFQNFIPARGQIVYSNSIEMCVKKENTVLTLVLNIDFRYCV